MNSFLCQPDEDTGDATLNPLHLPVRESAGRLVVSLEEITRRWMNEAGVITPQQFADLTGVSEPAAQVLLDDDSWDLDTVLLVLDTMLSTAVLPD